MAVALVQGPIDGNASSVSVAKAYSANVTAGNFLVAVVSCANNSVQAGTVDDSRSQTWTKSSYFQDPGPNLGCGIFYFASTSGGPCTVTFHAGAASTFVEITLYEFSGVATASLTDGATSAWGNSTALASGSITTTNANDLLIGAGETLGSGITSGTAGWNYHGTPNGNAAEYRIVSATGANNATFTASSAIWVANISAFKAASAATLHFPMAIADTSTVVALGLEIQRHFPLAIADTSSVALGFHLQGHFPLAVADTSTVVALGFRQTLHFSIAIADTSTVVALGFRLPFFSIGPTNPGPSTGSFSGIDASKVTLPQQATLTSISIFFTGNSGQAFLLGIYSDTGTQPGTLLASSALGSSVVGLNTLPISGGPTLSAGTYWLAIQCQTTIAGNYDSSAGASYYNSGQSWTGALPTAFPAGTSAALSFSLYASFSTVTAPRFPVVIADTSTVSLSFHAAAVSILKVQGPLSASGAGTTGPIAKAYGVNVTAGNFLVAAVNCASPTVLSPAVTDSLGQTWIKSTYSADSVLAVGSGIFYFPNTLAGACTVTFNPGAGAQFAEITLYEFSGIASASLGDGATSATGTSTTPASGNIVTLNANDLLIAGAVTAGSGITAGTSGWLAALTPNGNAAQYSVPNATGTYNATFSSGNDIFVANIAAFKGVGAAPPPTLDFPVAIADSSRVLALGFHGATMPSPGGGAYSTTFPLTENPISENSHWINGGVTGLDFTDIQTTPGLVFGTQPGNAQGPAQYADSTAVLTGTWGPNQTAQGTVRVIAAAGTGSGIFEEVELRLRTTITPHSITGYECLISVSTDPASNYVQIVRWNGPVGNFSELNGGAHHAVNGDIFKATISGSAITVYLNGVAVLTTNDSTYTTGSPGVGFYLANATGLNANYGFSAFSASDGTFGVHVADSSTVIALRFQGAGAPPRFGLAIADTSTVVALGFRVPQHFGVFIFDTSTVALGFHVARRFGLAITDTSSVVALGFESTAFVTNNFVLAISTATVRDDVTGFVGFKFQVGANPLVVRSLGRWVMPGRTSPGAVHQLQCLDQAGTLLGGVSLDTTGKPTGSFAYASLASPLTLPAGGTYQLLSQERSGSGDPWYSNDCVPLTTIDATVRDSVLISPLRFPLAIADTSTVMALSFHVSSGAGNSYSTAFPLTENPISESARWINGGVTGLDWTNCRSTAGLVVGTMTGLESGTAQYADSTAVLAGTWGPNQTVQATVRVISAPTAGGILQEVELRLRTTITPHSITGYEVFCSVSANSNNFYFHIARWNGPLGSFTDIDGRTAHAVDGDILKATIVGNVITGYLNGVQILQVTDSTYSGGSPGIGFFISGVSGISGNAGFSAFSATDH